MRIRSPSLPTHGIRAWSMAVAAALLLPLLLIAFLQAIGAHQDNIHITRDQLARRTESAANDLAMKLDIIRHSIVVLSDSKAARTGQMEDLYRTAQRVVATVPGVANVGLMDTNRRMRWITSQPLGMALSTPTNTEASSQAMTTGEVALGGVFKGPYLGQMVVTMAVPVHVDDVIRYCLIAVIPSSTFSNLLRDEALPAGWVASVFDQHHTITGRTHATEQFVGTPAAEATLRFLETSESGEFELRTKEGLLSTGYIAQVPRYGWRIGMAVPTDVMEAPLRATLVNLLIQLAMGIASTIYLGSWIGRYLERWFQTLVRNIREAQPGQAVHVTTSGVAEFDAVAHKLIRELQRRHDAQSALANAQESEAALADQLETAKVDLLTGLLRRRYFIDRMVELKRLADGDASLSVGAIFLDLDRFKQLNDEHGHHVGDQALQAVGAILMRLQAGQPQMVAGRWGGDEFVLALLEDRAGIDARLQCLMQKIRAEIRRVGQPLDASLGTAVWDDTCDGLDMFMRKVDTAMYAHKRRSRTTGSVRRNPRTAPTVSL